MNERITGILQRFLQLPEATKVEQRIAKTVFYENVRMTATDKKWFTADIEQITTLYQLKEDTVSIAAYKDDQFEYTELFVIFIHLRSVDHVERLAELMHRAIPYPLMLVFAKEATEQWYFSVAEKRFSQADERSATLKRLWLTSEINPYGISGVGNSEFLNNLHYEQLNKLHLKALYNSWISVFCSYELAKETGKYIHALSYEKQQEQQKLLDRLRKLNDEIATYRHQLEKETSYSSKVTLNMKIKEYEKEREELIEKTNK